MTNSSPLPPATALIAEDEPLLAQALRAELAAQWPQLRILAVAGDGDTALQQALALRPELLFLDIRMPGPSGLEVAQAVAEDWPGDVPLPLVVFVTAYDQYALDAFGAAAVDYVLKPVEPRRLAQTCARLARQLSQRRSRADDEADADITLAQLRRLLAGSAARSDPPPSKAQAEEPPLAVLPCAVGHAGEVRMVPLAEVVMLEAADKYVRVLTAQHEYLIRTSLKELLPRLDGRQFWQVHRGTVVRASAVRAATREESGRLRLSLDGRAERPVVSRLHAHLFRPL